MVSSSFVLAVLAINALEVSGLKLAMASPSMSQAQKWYDAPLTAYDGLLTQSPIGTKCVTSAVGFFLGDVIAQCLAKPREKVEKVTAVHKPGGPLIDIISVQEVPLRFDFKRSAIMTSFGLFLHGPFCHHLFNFLENLLPGRELSAVLQKVLLDQVVFCPLFSTVFLTYVSLLGGKKLSSLASILQTDLPVMVFTSWKVWAAVHVCSYLFVPLRFRVLFVNAVQVFYSVFLSILGSKAEPAEPTQVSDITASSTGASEPSDRPTPYNEARELGFDDDERYF